MTRPEYLAREAASEMLDKLLDIAPERRDATEHLLVEALGRYVRYCDGKEWAAIPVLRPVMVKVARLTAPEFAHLAEE